MNGWVLLNLAFAVLNGALIVAGRGNGLTMIAFVVSAIVAAWVWGRP